VKKPLCELCIQRISLSRADSFCAKLAKDRKAHGGGVVSKEGRPDRSIILSVTEYEKDKSAVVIEHIGRALHDMEH
jgi:hypothetical protein